MTSVTDNGKIQFRFYRPGASEIHIVGSFNDWQRGQLPMRELGNGWWAAESDLEPGEYQFRYIADGHWFTDYAAHGVEKTKHGWNSILIVPDETVVLYPRLAREVATELETAVASNES